MVHCGSVLMRPNVQGKPAAAKTVGRQNTRDPPLGLTDLLGVVCVFVFVNPSEARRLSLRRLTISRQLFVFVSPSDATDDQLAGQRSDGFEEAPAAERS